VSPDGKFLYANSRTYKTIAIYSIDQSTGELRNVGYAPTDKLTAFAATGPTNQNMTSPPVNGAWEQPLGIQHTEQGARMFDWDASATWVASGNLGENAVVILRRDAESGALTPTGQILHVPQPSFVLFVRPFSNGRTR
jgi:6-phosphogluconolactonase (cycloisomerase 2 family)